VLVIVRHLRLVVPPRRRRWYDRWVPPRRDTVGAIAVQTSRDFRTTLAAIGGRPLAKGVLLETPDKRLTAIEEVLYVMAAGEDDQPHFEIIVR
jgi:hypothetical protein